VITAEKFVQSVDVTKSQNPGQLRV